MTGAEVGERQLLPYSVDEAQEIVGLVRRGNGRPGALRVVFGVDGHLPDGDVDGVVLVRGRVGEAQGEPARVAAQAAADEAGGQKGQQRKRLDL